MDFIERFSENLAKIDTLNASFYEKDLISSAYYNHLNNLPISRDSREIMKKYGISFEHKKIVKKSPNVESLPNNLEQISQMAQSNANEIDKILRHTQEVLDEIFSKSEISYRLIADLIEILSHKKSEIIKALNDFVEAFSGDLQSVENDNKQEILQKCQNLLQSLLYCHNQAVKLCIKILSIRANKILKNDLDSYVNAMSAELRRYLW